MAISKVDVGPDLRAEAEYFSDAVASFCNCNFDKKFLSLNAYN
jgi:hypothetical protein